jgi:hypothetical protein
MRTAKLNLVIVVVAGILVGGGKADAKFYYTEPASYATPTNLGSVVNSSDWESGPGISADGLSLYLDSDRGGGYGRWDLWVATRPTPDADWDTLENLGSTINDSNSNGFADISADGLTLYFMVEDGGYGDLWVTTRATPNEPWGEPVNLGPPVNSQYTDAHPSISADGLSLYFSSRITGQHHPNGFGESDIWLTTRASTSAPWGIPSNLGSVVNSSSCDAEPSISANELALFFMSNRSGDEDLWVTTRPSSSDPWGAPAQLPPHVNSEFWEFMPDISHDGSTLFFISRRGGGVGGLDIWQVRILELDERATDPSPTDGATDVPDNVVLSWSPGAAGVAAFHDVYFGTGFDDVNNATTSSAEYKGRQSLDADSYNPPEQLGLLRTYYWRIDEVNDPCLWKGSVWSFTTGNYVVLDDMEDYNDSNPIWDTWIDGWENDTGSVIGLGTDPCDPVHGGRQSMIYDYDNDSIFGLYKYSEAYRTISDPCDWTIFGVEALVLYFYGKPGNDANEQTYVGLEDSRGPVSYAEARYGDAGEDMNDIKEQEWHEWNVELQDFNDAGVILTDVNRVYIGFGDRDNPVAGGSGTVYFDDIRLYIRRCVPEFAAAADFTDDCLVNLRDFGILASQWLQPPGSPSADIAQPPDGIVNSLDLRVLADSWLTEDLWPAE